MDFIKQQTDSRNIAGGGLRYSEILDQVILDSKGSVTVPKGRTDQRPVKPEDGMLRFNVTTNKFEYYGTGIWSEPGELEADYAEEWATAPVDVLVSIAAGGNGVSDYSSLHWATKASNISGAKGGGTNKIFWENDMVVTDDYTISAGKNAGSFGPITIDDGVTVTVPSGQSWSIV